METLIWESLIQIDILWKNLSKQYKFTLLVASSLHKLYKMIVFQLQSLHQQDEELSLKHGCSYTMLKNHFGSISVWILSSTTW